MNERLKILLDVLDMSQKEFAESVGLYPGRVNDLLKGRTNDLSSESIRRIMSKYNVNPTWLLTGEGSMFNSPSTNINISNVGNGVNNTNNIHITLTPEEEAIVEAMRKAKRRKGVLNAIKALLGLALLILVTRWIG